MKAYRDLFHLLLSGKNRAIMNISGLEIKNTDCKKLLGIMVDCGLKLENYLDCVYLELHTM